MTDFKQLLLFTLIFLLLSACATSPTGRHQLMLVSEDSAIASSKQAYLSTVKQLDDAGKLEENWVINKRIEVITGQLITEAIKMRPDTADWEWSVVVIDDPKTINAWCMAGGRMAIYTGLIKQLDPSDDELAQVMAHEISHALAKHTAEKMSMQVATSIGVAAVGIASDNTGVALSGAALTAMLAVNLPNSRAAEKEADQIGIELAAKAGFNPAAAATLWQKMGGASKSGTPQFLSTHPEPENRQRELAKLEPKMQKYYFPHAEHPIYKMN
ncbi:MAG: M48 family metallopeptidase [Gammaproteobacteria bacterium]|nr:M48 family metallopeptidase [Gammaproteobacteria bacterium]